MAVRIAFAALLLLTGCESNKHPERSLEMILSLPKPVSMNVHNVAQIAHMRHNLAPHPISFTVNGKPSEISVPYDGEEYTMTWDGEKLSMKKGKPVNRIWKYFPKRLPPNDEPPDEPYTVSGCAMGCALILVINGGFWGGLIWLILALI
jgi:hypothetical protein